MTRINAILTALFLALFVGACESNIDNDDNDDTGIPAETLTITVEAYLDDIKLDKQPLSIEDTAIIAEGVTGEPIELKLRSDAQVMIGEVESNVSTDGYRVHNIGEANYVHRTVTVGSDTSETPITVSLISYFQSDDGACTWYRDGSVIEVHEEGTIETEQGYILRLDKTLGQGSWLEFDGTSFEIKGDMAHFPVTDMETGVDYIAYSFDDGVVRNDYVCEF